MTEVKKNNPRNGYKPAEIKKLKAKFLKHYPETKGMLWTTAKMICISGNTIRKWLDEDDDFREAAEAIKEECLDRIETVAKNRAEGYTEDVWYKGEVVGQKNMVSEKMAEMMLTNHRGYSKIVKNIDETVAEKRKRILEKSDKLTSEQLAQNYMDEVNGDASTE
jgi:hypothetical protein